MAADEIELTCAECLRQPSDDEDPDDEWRLPDISDELLVFCPECAEREFGAKARTTARLR